MADVDLTRFSMESPHRVMPPTMSRLVNNILRQAEKWLEPIYGEEHINWHELCLVAKQYIKDNVNNSLERVGNVSHNEQEEIARLALVKTLQQFEVNP